MIVLIDNYDSFTFNLVQYLRQIGATVKVYRNDHITVSEIEKLQPKGIVISPGPGRPESAGVSMSVVNRLSKKIPILGVCLGHQTIAEAFGGDVIPAKRLMHGKTSSIEADGESIFKGIKSPFQAMRYHSLAVDRKTIPSCLKITAKSEDGEIMGIRHKEQPVEGIQFHPESIMTPVGKRILRNFLNANGRRI